MPVTNPFKFDRAAIVGNAPSLLKHKHGERIDNDERVFRFNQFEIGGYGEHTGRKTTDHVCAYYDATGRPEYNIFCPLPLNQLEWYDLSLKYYDGKHDWHQAIKDDAICQPWQLYQWLLHTHTHPSSGLALLWWMYHVRPQRLHGVSVYGFNCFEPDKNGNYHYWEQNSNGGHDGDAEKLLIGQLITEGGGTWI